MAKNIISSFKFTATQFGLEEEDTNLNKFFHCDENVETYQCFLEICLGPVE